MTLSEAKAFFDSEVERHPHANFILCKWVRYKKETWGIVVSKSGHLSPLVRHDHHNTDAVEEELRLAVKKIIPYYMGPQYYEHNPS